MIPGTEGYSEHAEELVKRFEAVSFSEKHEAVMHLLPPAPSTVLDVGAGTGVDAAWFASTVRQAGCGQHQSFDHASDIAR